MGEGTYADDTFSETYDVHVDGLEKVLAILILLECAVIDEVVVAEKLDLLACFLHENILGGERVDAEGLGETSHLGFGGREHVQPPGRSRTEPLRFTIRIWTRRRGGFAGYAWCLGFVVAESGCWSSGGGLLAVGGVGALVRVVAVIITRDVLGQILSILLALVVAEFKWIGDEEFSEGLAGLQELGDGLTVDGAGEVLVEVGKSVGGVFLGTMPGTVIRSQSAADQDGFIDLLCTNSLTSFLLLVSTPVV